MIGNAVRIDRFANSLDKPGFLQRLQHYAPLVKRIGYPGYFSREGTFFDYNSLYHLHASATLPRPLFPNVVEVVLPCLSERQVEAIFYPSVVLSPSIRKITIFTDCFEHRDEENPIIDNTQWTAVSNRLQSQAPNLDSFGIYCDTESTGRIPSIDSLCHHFSSSLKCLDMSYLVLQPETICTLGKLDSLDALQFTVNDYRFVSPLSEKIPLTKLSFLGLRVDSAAGLDTLFQSILAPSIERVELTFMALDSIVHLGDTFKALTQNCALPKLYDVDIVLVDDVDHYFPISAATFTPLLRCNNIKTIQIGGCAMPVLEDADLLQIFSSWPDLSHFSMSLALPCQGSLYRGGLTLAGVHAALQLCPKLHTLELPFDARVVPTDSTLPSSPHPSLRSLDVFTSPITFGFQVGQFFRKFYPLLKSRQFSFYDMYKTQFYWETTPTAEHFSPSVVEGAMMVDQWIDVEHMLAEDP
ncbi:hypothetical protein CC1G_14109 [Coprinopsis cinerea okayama7|uniref:F-box domain-containing protein n=1 Tax=Coprinopsis cinerea (strain Okayama-7 / 130 / ATCC MYA-4618 / FGSC 9003) TaxID=240176 RepID=D6RLJ0_COPC7|nr:hypothetical protein CC1G_14109 [Coprinopsis cinerea okayama7\|eukprot:XP_002911576.1 hypothetical protein CC1G_14109 [Coprinopsis cinerea okayama7\